MRDALTGSRWLLGLRGVVAILFGILAILFPGLTLQTLVILFGAYALVDGVFDVITAFRNRERNPRWWALLLEGAIGIIVGILVFLNPLIAEITLLYVVAGWSILTGILEIIAAIELRKQINNEVLLGIAGILSVLFGFFLILFPITGLLTIAYIIAAYAFAFGVLMIILALRLGNVPTDNASTLPPAGTVG